MNLRIFNFYPTVNQFLFAICSISLCIRVILMSYGFPNENYLMHADQKDYLRLANVLGENLNFDKNFGSIRLPIYPLFISFVLKINQNLYFLVFVQHLIGLLTILTIFKIGKIFSLEIGLIAAFFAAINFNLAIHGNFILTESIFVLIFTIFLYFSLQFLKNRNVKFLILTGLFLGLSSLIRPAVIYLPFLIIFFILFLNFRFLKKIKFIVLFLAFYMVVVLPWLTRNHLIYESFSFTSQETTALIGWYLPHIDQYEKKINIADARKLRKDDWQLFLNDIPDKQKSNPFKLEKFVKRYAVQEIAKFEKISIIKAWFWGAMKNIFSPPFVDFAYFYKIPHSSFYETQGASFLKQFKNFVFKNSNIFYSIGLLFGIFFIIIFRGIQLYGFLLMAKSKRTEFLFFLMIIIYFLMISGPIGYAKYRIPYEPILIIYTAFSLLSFKNILKLNKN